MLLQPGVRAAAHPEGDHCGLGVLEGVRGHAQHVCVPAALHHGPVGLGEGGMTWEGVGGNAGLGEGTACRGARSRPRLPHDVSCA